MRVFGASTTSSGMIGLLRNWVRLPRAIGVGAPISRPHRTIASRHYSTPSGKCQSSPRPALRTRSTAVCPRSFWGQPDAQERGTGSLTTQCLRAGETSNLSIVFLGFRRECPTADAVLVLCELRSTIRRWATCCSFSRSSELWRSSGSRMNASGRYLGKVFLGGRRRGEICHGKCGCSPSSL